MLQHDVVMFDVVMLINGLGTWPVNNKQVAEDTHPPNSLFFVSLVFTWRIDAIDAIDAAHHA